MTSVRHSYIWKITIGDNNAAAAYFIPIMQPLGYIFFFQSYVWPLFYFSLRFVGDCGDEFGVR